MSNQLPFDVAVPHVVSNHDLIAISLDWTENTPRRRPGESNDEFARRKDWFMRRLTARWRDWRPEPEGPRDPAVFGPPGDRDHELAAQVRLVPGLVPG